MNEEAGNGADEVHAYGAFLRLYLHLRPHYVCRLAFLPDCPYQAANGKRAVAGCIPTP